MSSPFNPSNPTQSFGSQQGQPQYAQGVTPSPQKKKGIGKGAGVGIGAAVLVLLGAAACGSGDGGEAASTSSSTAVTTTEESSILEEVRAESSTSEIPEEAPVDAATPEDDTSDDVPMEFKQAKRSAESYLRFSAFSYQGLYDQLTSEYADAYSPEAAQYAVDNVDADWYAEAVESAKSYLEFSGMSPNGLYEQLTSPYADQYTPEQAQHAVDTVYGE